MKKKKWIMLFPYFLLWLLYDIVTVNERLQYAKAMEKGMDCYSSKDASVFFYGSVTEFKYDPTSPPIRRYLKWKEFWSLKGSAIPISQLHHFDAIALLVASNMNLSL